MNTTTNGAPTGRKNGITGIHVDKINRKLIIAEMVRLKLIEPGTEPDGTAEALSLEIWAKLAELPIERQIRCDACAGIGDEKTDNCPYCGHDKGTSMVDELAAKAQPAAAPKIKGDGLADVVPHAQKPGVSKTKPKQEANMGATETTTSKAIVKNDTKKSTDLRTERDLDTAVHAVQDLKGEGAAAAWRLGAKVKEIYDGRLWKLRVDKDDKGKEKARWASWDAFVHGELGMTPKNAGSLMDISKTYSIEQVTAFGTTKLGLILTAPPEDQPALISQAKNGASASEIRAAVKDVKKKKNHVRQSRGKDTSAGAKAGAKAKAEKTQKAKDSKAITVASIIGAQQVKLYKKPASLKGFDPKTAPRAKKIGDSPFGRLELTNEVSMYFTVSESPAGELVLKVVTQREAAEE